MASFETLHSFLGPPNEGVSPDAALTQGKDGNFYGTTYSGGDSNGDGTVFEITPAGVFTTLYAFTGGVGGANPAAALTQGSDGNFYGTTPEDSFGDSTLFKITPAGVLTTLYTFTGRSPRGALIQGNDGNFYGTTTGSGYGTVFKVTPAGTLNYLYTFSGGADGAGPTGLTQGSDGNFYGTTSGGGDSNGDGTVFKITPTGALTTLYAFTGEADGFKPLAGLTQGNDGNFYGTTFGGPGTNQDGTVFKITPAGVLTTLYTFTGGSDGAKPQADLSQGSDGNLYGTTSGGGDSNGDGTVFEITPSGTFTSLYTFTGGADGAGPYAGLTLGSDGNFYGTTFGGGQFRSGVVFRLTLPPALPVVTLVSTIPNVNIDSGDIGEFTVSLSAPQTSDVIVTYAIKGSAINGTDYVTLSGTKKIKAGKTSKPIKIIPEGDLGGASKKVVTLVLNPGDGYTIGTTGKVKVKILSAGQ